METTFESLMEEIGFHLNEYDKENIDKDDLINAIQQVHEFYNTTITIWKKINNTTYVSRWRSSSHSPKQKENKELTSTMKWLKYMGNAVEWATEDTKYNKNPRF